MKIKLKGFIEVVGAVVPTQNKKGFVQNVILMIPGFRDSFGQIQGRDQWPMISVYSTSENDQKFVPRSMGTDKILECEVNLTFDRVMKKDSNGVYLDGQFMYFPRLFMGAWKLVGERKAESQDSPTLFPNGESQAKPVAETAGEFQETDDLPF